MISHGEFKISPGVKVLFQGKAWIIKKNLSLTKCLLLSLDGNKVYVEAPIDQIMPESSTVTVKPLKQMDLHDIPEKYWATAKRRFSLIKPILDKDTTTEQTKAHAKLNNVHIATLYRWLNLYKRTGTISSLIPELDRGGKGKGRLSEELEVIVTGTIEEEYLSSQKKSMVKVYEAIKRKCHAAGIKHPHESTVRLRIKNLDAERVLKGRYGKRAAADKFAPLKGHYNEAKYPLSVVQIDHTKLDIILVDEIYRKPLLRPWITVAIDVFSRMIVGVYISFDPPGALAVGMCLSHAILPKEIGLNKLDITGEWPNWGVMRTIHADNGKDFRGDMLQRAAEEYGIDIQWRPVKVPNWGGHIERLIGTLVKEIHALPGTTFSKISERKNYNSEKKAALTLPEFEKWLTTFIVNVYHKRVHKGIGTSPLDKYTEGIFGSSKIQGVGLPSKLLDERKVKLDFLPFVTRTIQEYGVKIDHINYYDEVLRKWIHSLEFNYDKAKRKREFIFKRDPRDISVIYFFDPELKQYFEIPYRDISHPPMTIWEYNAVENWLSGNGKKIINEADIFEGYKAMKEIEERALLKTKGARSSKKEIKKHYSHSKSLRSELGKEVIVDSNESKLNTVHSANKILPFEDLDYGTYS